METYITVEIIENSPNITFFFMLYMVTFHEFALKHRSRSTGDLLRVL